MPELAAPSTTADLPEILRGPAELEGYRAQVLERLRARRGERLAFLDIVVRDLEPLLADAAALGDEEVVRDVETQIRTARDQITAIRELTLDGSGQPAKA